MAWDDTLPTNQTKIRNYPTVLTANFAALEQGASTLKYWKSNYIDRSSDATITPNTPVRIDDTMQLYSRANDYSGETDFFILDDRGTANELALTEDGYIGGQGQSALFQDVTIGTNTFANNQNNFVWAYGVVPANGGAVSGGAGLGTATYGGSGVYTIPITRTPSNTNYHVLCTSIVNTGSQANNRVANLVSGSKTTGQFQVRTQRVDGTNINDVPFQVILIGGF